MQMKRPLLMLAALLLAVTALLAGCGGGADSSGSNGNGGTGGGGAGEAARENADRPGEAAEPSGNAEPFSIVLRHIQIGEPQKFRKAILDDVVSRTEQEVPGLTIELDGVEDKVNRFTKLPAEMAAGNPPQIFSLFGGAGDAQKYAAAGRLLDLTPILEELGIRDKFLNVLEPFSVDGKVYGLPIGGNTEGIFYNTEIFANLGLNAPTTWDDLIRAAETLKANGITPFAVGSKGAWVPNMLVNTLIGRLAGPEAITGLAAGTHRWDAPEVVAAYELYQDWVEAGYFTKGELGLEYGDMLNEFVAGKAGMMFDGSWRSSAFKDDNIGAAVVGKVAFVPLPPVPGGKGDQTSVNANYGEGYGFSSNLNDRELVAVKAFIKFMYSDEMQLRGLLEDGVLPSMKLSADALAQVEDPIVKQVIDVLGNAGATFPHFDSVVSSKVYAETETQLQNIIGLRTTPQEAAEAIQKVQAEESAAQ